MQLLDHASISVRDIDLARIFYDAVMSALGCEKVYDRTGGLGYGVRCSATEPTNTFLAVYLSSNANVDDKRHWCFKAESQSRVRDFYDAALANGGKCDGPPGLRPRYHEFYYAAFVLDPQGNRIEAVCHAPR